MRKYNLYDPRELPDLVRSWKTPIEPQQTADATHLLVLQAQWTEEIAARFELELKRQTKETNG